MMSSKERCGHMVFVKIMAVSLSKHFLDQTKNSNNGLITYQCRYSYKKKPFYIHKSNACWYGYFLTGNDGKFDDEYQFC